MLNQLLSFLLKRPIGVLLTFTGLLIFSVLAGRELPVSLLPEAEVPQLAVRVSYPNGSPELIEKNLLKPLRNQLMTLSGLKDIRSRSAARYGLIELRFEYGTDMKLAYIEAAEKTDRAMSFLPQDAERPKIIRVSSTDIPVCRLQIVPDSASDPALSSEFLNKVIKKRFEAIKGVALVDANGLSERSILVRPKPEKIAALGLEAEAIGNIIRTGNAEIGNISVRDGQYRFFIRVDARLQNADQISDIRVPVPSGGSVSLREITEVRDTLSERFGAHLFQGNAAFVLRIHKQAQARMPDLMPLIYETARQIREENPHYKIQITQDQSELMRSGTDSLKTALQFGGLFAFLVLFAFMGNWRTPLIIGITLPVSLLLSLIPLYAFGVSVNVVSLSGLALGLGMLIDNSIIVLDNISRMHDSGESLDNGCRKGVMQVLTPLTSSVLTTLSVFIPLVFADGLTGILFRDQAIAISAILGTSLLVAYALLPLIYKLILQKKREALQNMTRDSRLFLLTQSLYERLYRLSVRFRLPVFVMMLSLLGLVFWAFSAMPRSGMPVVEKRDLSLQIDWNEPISLEENLSRIHRITAFTETEGVILSESEVGKRQYLLETEEAGIQQAEIYFLCEDEAKRKDLQKSLEKLISISFPQASFTSEASPNAFDQLFLSNEPYLEVKLRRPQSPEPADYQDAASFFSSGEGWKPGRGFERETALLMELDRSAIRAYKTDEREVMRVLRLIFSAREVTAIRSFGEETKVLMQYPNGNIAETLARARVKAEGGMLPLGRFVKFRYSSDFKYRLADRSGVFQNVLLQEGNEDSFSKIDLKNISNASWIAEFSGRFLTDRERLRKITVILVIALLLLYFILAAQFESLTQPLLVLLTVPMGMGGSLLLLWLFGESLNFMSGIGLIVMSGIMVNDAILKIDTINRLSRKLPLEEAIHEAGLMRLKPIIMTSVTTVLAVLPVIFSSGIGADLQRPLALAVIGGLSVGTFTAVFFVPTAYFYLRRIFG